MSQGGALYVVVNEVHELLVTVMHVRRKLESYLRFQLSGVVGDVRYGTNLTTYDWLQLMF